MGGKSGFMKHLAITLFLCPVLLAASLALQCDQNDTILKEMFCQVYYYKGGSGDRCARLRSNVCADHTTLELPVLTMGDPTHPPMLFLHGWPDQSALWANQFEAFCAPPNGKYYCIAPSWFDFHPDVPARSEG